MPLHVGDDSDKGGNGKEVRYYAPNSRSKRGHVTNLHSLWDNLIAVKAAEEPAAFAQEVDLMFNEAQTRPWAVGSPVDWAFESYQVSKNRVYPGWAPGPTVKHTTIPMSST